MHIDAELGFISFDDLLTLMSELLHTLWIQYGMLSRRAKKLERIRPVLADMIPRMPMEEIHERYTKATSIRTIGEKDLRPDEEKWICEYAKKNLGSEAIFVTEWPASEAKFYHKIDEENPHLAVRADLLFRGVEIATGSMREHRYDVLVRQLRELAGGDPEAEGFRYYLSAFRYGMPPHGGFGMGLERLTQKIIGLSNIKEATLFPRDINRLAP